MLQTYVSSPNVASLLVTEEKVDENDALFLQLPLQKAQLAHEK